VDSEMRREMARHQQADLARAAERELLLSEGSRSRPLPFVRMSLRRFMWLRLRTKGQEQLPDAALHLDG
jgi:hypothetical protein